MSIGLVRVTPEFLAKALFPGADVQVLRVVETPEDLMAGTVSLRLSGAVFGAVPEGCMSPYYTAIVTRHEDGAETTEFSA